jgi:phosphoserine phosphatase RsbU/P
MSRSVLLFLLLWPLAGFAQSMVTVSPQQCVWRFGENPAWAAPNLDESGWQPSGQWKLPVEEPHLWARCHADLGALRGTAHPAIQVTLEGAYQLYVNGELVGGAGNVRSGAFGMNVIRQFPLPEAAVKTQRGFIALRITRRTFGMLGVPRVIGGRPLEIYTGDSEALSGRRAGVVLTESAKPLTYAVCFALIGVAGLIMLGLFYYDRSRIELLYLSIVCAGLAAVRTNEFCSAALMNYSSALFAAIFAAGNIAAPVAAILFFFALARRRVPPLYGLLLAIVIAEDMLIGLGPLLPLDQANWLLGLLRIANQRTFFFAITEMALATAPFVAFWPYRRISRRMRPLAVLCALWGTANFAWYTIAITGDPRLGLPNLFASWRPELLGIRALVTASVLVALLGLLFRDQRRVTEERALLAGEMQAASEIQRLLAPAVLATAPGMRIEVAFHPVREVGGDFYSCRILPGNRQRILIGDVSGKGAAAAMTAAVLIGAAQRRDGESPAALLAHLNDVLVDMRLGGFATCLCAELSSAGDLTVANAGHLAPYRNGQEIAVENGLPLGILPEGRYGEFTLQLAPNDSLMLLSDGVIEAKGSNGELFGFERTAAISTQPAEEVAKAAQAFGQEDDITVLSLTFAPVGVAHA